MFTMGNDVFKESPTCDITKLMKTIQQRKNRSFRGVGVFVVVRLVNVKERVEK